MCLVSGQILAASIAIIIASYADRLQLKTEQETRQKLVNLFDRQVDEVWLVKNGVESKISIEQLQAGDVIAIHTGEMIPVDGVLNEGFISVDQHMLTGESQPVEKGVGEQVFASTLVLAGKAYVSVDKVGTETVSAQIADILDNTLHYTQQNVVARSTQFTDRQAVPVLVSTAAVFLVSGFYPATSFIIAWSPGRVRVLSSIAMLKHLDIASSEGLLVKDGRALEQFNHIDVMVFDKTGTLTDDQPEVGEIHVCNDFTARQVLGYTATAESNLTHPIARAIVQAAQSADITLPDETLMSEYQLGYGISGRINGQLVRVGSRRFMEKENILIPDHVEQIYNNIHTTGSSAIFAALENQLMGVIELRPTIRPETQRVIQSLRDNGVERIAIVSGDHESPTKALAAQLGVDDYVSEALPQDKVNYIKKMQSNNKVVCFVGDGVNDSLALKQAHVGISMTGASNIATETAHIVLMKHDLSLLSDLALLSKSLNKTNDRNMFIASLAPGVAGTCLAVLLNVGAFPVILLGMGALGLGLVNTTIISGSNNKGAKLKNAN
jgi:Cu2+-exporting ATPase